MFMHAGAPQGKALALGLLLVAIGLASLGQLLLKMGLKQLGSETGALEALKAIVTNVTVFGGFLCYGLSSLVYIIAIAKLPLSYAYPMVAISYVIVAALSWKLLGEAVPPLRIAGLTVIIVGVVITALSYGSEAPPSPGRPAVEQGAAAAP